MKPRCKWALASRASVCPSAGRSVHTSVSSLGDIAAVRLAQDEHPARSSPRLMYVVSDSISIARNILERVLKASI